MVLRGIIAAAVVAVLAQEASAATVTFDDLSGGGVLISNGYQGLNWNNFYSYSGATAFSTYGANGYTNGVVSANNVAYNGFGSTAITSNSIPFTFNSAYFTAAWYNGLTISVDGYLGGNLVDSTSFVVNATGPTLETFNWNIDQLVFNSSGGTSAGYAGSGEHFAMDNMVINQAAAVPLPASFGPGLALLSALAGVAFLRQRRRAVA